MAYRTGKSSKPSIDLYSCAGKLIKTIPWEHGAIKGLGWSEDEKLIVVTKDGVVRCYYDLQGDFTQFSLGNGAEESGVQSCRCVQVSAVPKGRGVDQRSPRLMPRT